LTHWQVSHFRLNEVVTKIQKNILPSMRLSVILMIYGDLDCTMFDKF